MSLAIIIKRTSDRFKSWLLKLQRKSAIIAGKIRLPGFDGVSLYDTGVFFYKGNIKSSINIRASAISFDFFLAAIQAILFFFTLIPYLPIPDLQTTVMQALKESMPDSAYETIRYTIEDIVSRQQGGLLSIGFVLSLFFASNGMIAIIKTFNQSAHAIESRKWLWLRIISILLILIIAMIVIIAAVIQILSYNMLELAREFIFMSPLLFKLLFIAAKYFIYIFILFGAFSFIYYLAPAKRTRFRFISAGSTLATVLSVIGIELFSLIINNFGQYNKIYGSLGTLIVILLWINLNSRILLIGYELNASIYSARLQADTRKEDNAE